MQTESPPVYTVEQDEDGWIAYPVDDEEAPGYLLPADNRADAIRAAERMGLIVEI